MSYKIWSCAAKTISLSRESLEIRILYSIPYIACSDWVKQSALTEINYGERVDDIKLAFKFLLREFRQI